MISIAFPEMFDGPRVKLVEGHDATISNMRLLLASWKNSLLGDPYFGTKLKTFIYEQNNIILKDLIVDDIFTSLQEFIPQVYLERKDIEVKSKGTSVYATITCTDRIDKSTNMYEIKLLTQE